MLLENLQNNKALIKEYQKQRLISDKYHYVYEIRLSVPIDKKWRYIGVRSSFVKPEKDSYIGSPSCSKSCEYKTAILEESAKFEKVILGVFSSREEAEDEEIRLHKLHDVMNNSEFFNAVNANKAGFTTRGFKHSQDSKELISKKAKGRKLSEETKKKIGLAVSKRITESGNPMFGKSLSKEHKNKLSKASSGRNNGMFGKKHSKESIEKMRQNTDNSGSKNPRAKKIAIYNKENQLMAITHGNFKTICLENDWPYAQLAKSYRTNSLYLPKRSRKNIDQYSDFFGWYAKEEML